MKYLEMGCLATVLLCGTVISEYSQAEETPAALGVVEAAAPQKSSEPVQIEAGPAKQDAKIVATEKLLSTAESLMKEGRYKEAYAWLQPFEFSLAGDKHFDYLLGIAALDSGKPDKATLAFERVLAVDPNFAGARMDMARAYYQLGDLARAKIEFELVMKQNPPQAASVTIQKYLDAINAREKVERTHLTAYFEGGLGHDSNINAATSQAQISVPAFGNMVFTLNPGSMRTSGNYEGLAGGAEVNHLLNADLGLYAGMDLRQRGYRGHAQFDSLDVAAHAGVFYHRDSEVFRLGLTGDQYRLGSAHQPNRDTSGLGAEWRHQAGANNQLTTFGQFARNRFIGSGMEVQNFDLALLGESWLHALADGKSAVFGSLFAGRETAVAPVTSLNPSGGRPDGDKTLLGLRVGTQINQDEMVDYFASMGFQRGNYSKDNLAFLAKRTDTLWDLNAGANLHLDKDWTLRPQLVMSRNKSNIPIYSFNRLDVSVLLRWDFK